MPDSEDEIKVTDKRKFDKDGNIKENTPIDEKKVDTKSSKSASEQAKSGSEKTESRIKKDIETNEKNKREQQAIDFIPFILSIYTSILANFGELPDTSGIKIEKNIAQAKELIDIIKMLRDKTKGNLNEDEQNVIDEIIYQSEMIYVKSASDLKI